MYKLFILLIACGAITITTFAQNDDIRKRKLKLESNIWTGNHFYQGVSEISSDELLGIVSTNPEALQLMNKGVSLQRTATVFAVIGGACIGYPLGQALAGSESPSWALAGVGAASIVVGLPIFNSGKRKMHESIEVYNEELMNDLRTYNSGINRIEFVASGDGAGIRMTF